MHSFHGKKFNFHYDSDFRGEVHIVNKETNEETKMNAEELLEFIAECYLRSKRIQEIGSKDWKELF